MEGGKINNRNSNIDMIRIVAMLLVVALHCMDYGGFIKLSEANLFLFLFVSLNHTISIEQNRCAMACQGCGAVLFLLKSSGITFHNPLLLSYHTKQLN